MHFGEFVFIIMKLESNKFASWNYFWIHLSQQADDEKDILNFSSLFFIEFIG